MVATEFKGADGIHGGSRALAKTSLTGTCGSHQTVVFKPRRLSILVLLKVRVLTPLKLHKGGP